MKSKVKTDESREEIRPGDLVLMNGNNEVQKVCKFDNGDFCLVGITEDDDYVGSGYADIDDMVKFENLTKFHGTVELSQ